MLGLGTSNSCESAASRNNWTHGAGHAGSARGRGSNGDYKAGISDYRHKKKNAGLSSVRRALSAGAGAGGSSEPGSGGSGGSGGSSSSEDGAESKDEGRWLTPRRGPAAAGNASRRLASPRNNPPSSVRAAAAVVEAKHAAAVPAAAAAAPPPKIVLFIPMTVLSSLGCTPSNFGHFESLLALFSDHGVEAHHVQLGDDGTAEVEFDDVPSKRSAIAMLASIKSDIADAHEGGSREVHDLLERGKVEGGGGRALQTNSGGR